MPSVTRDDRILPIVRGVAALIVVALLLAVWILYLQPNETARLWAWTIKAHMTALLMGAGYAAGCYYFIRVLAPARWHEVSLGFFAITAFTWWMGIATILHWDTFNHHRVAFVLWSGLYFTTPLFVPALWIINRHTDPRTPMSDDLTVPIRVRRVVLVVGLITLLLGQFLFMLPDQARRVWPWPLTPLSSQVVGGFITLSGLNGIVITFDSRWSAWRILLESLALGFVLLLVGAIRAWSDFDTANVLTWLLLGGFLGGLVGLVALYGSMEVRRSQRRTLRPAGKAMASEQEALQNRRRRWARR